METPIFGIFGAAIHPRLWMPLYKQLSLNNTTPFEIVFVGDVRPDFALPENFIYIYSEAKPVQCYEIARRNTKGEYLMWFGDDILLSLRFLDAMYVHIRKLLDHETIVYSRMRCSLDLPPIDSVEAIEQKCYNVVAGQVPCMNAHSLDFDAPIVGLTMTVRRSVWEELGGLDRRFTNILSDCDFLLRFYEAGGCPFIVPNAIATEDQPSDLKDYPVGRQRLSVMNPHVDQGLWKKCWLIKDDLLSKKRLVEFQPFTEDEIPIVR